LSTESYTAILGLYKPKENYTIISTIQFTRILMTTLIVLLSVILLSQPKMNNYLSNSSYDTANNSAAQIERSVRRVWIKCTEAEETNRKIKKLIVAKVAPV
jgi:CHASE2 domain-containing sensor protein